MPSVICADCGHANGGEARFCEQCGNSLAPRCPSCGAEVSATARFCSSCGSPIAAEAPASGALKVVSVVFSDVVGSTELQETLEPESVRRVMARFYEVMREVVRRHDGAIQKFIGDAVVAVFGVPSVSEDDAVRAVRCAAAMAAGLEDLNDELDRTWGVRLQIRTGVNTGELAISDEGIFVGDTMNTAARLEQSAGTGQVLLGEATWRLVRHEVEVEEIAPLEAKGKSTPLRRWQVVSTKPRAAAAEAPLVGRASELERLRSGLEETIAAQACRLVTLIGSPGLGKSRLAAEFARSLEGQATVLEGHCEHSGEGITFLPVADVLRAAASIADDDPPEQVVAKLTQTVPETPDRERVVARVAGLLGAGAPAAPEETFWGVRTVLESLARDRPLVVVLDDVHWGQPMFLDLIEHLVEWARDAAILLVAIARPELRETRGALTASGRRATDVIELDPLGPDQSRELVSGLLGQVELPDELLARILETTEGNPLFLGELLRMLVEEGSLQRTGDVWVAAGGAEAVQVPPTIQALLTARIERLRADERSVVERASVIGKQFYRGAVAELVAPPIRSGIDGHLETLRRKDMVEPEGTYWIDEPVYRFHHVLIRDAAYHLLLKEARAELHEKFADWLETKAGELVGEHEEVIAYHLEQAHEYRRQLGPLDEKGKAVGLRAAERLASAGRRALAREDLAAAANLLQRALERGAGVSEDEMLWHLGEALISAGDTAAASLVVSRLSGPRADVLGAQLAVLTGVGSLEETLDRVLAATSALAAAGDAAAEAKGHHVTAQVQAQLGRVGDVETSLDHALLAARKADDRRRITAVLAAAPRAALWGPSPVVRASGRCLDVVRILRMTPGNRHVEAVALRCQAVLEAMRGRPDAAREILDGGRATLEELGLTLELYELAMHGGIVELLAGQPGRAEELLRTARDGFAGLGVSVSAAQAASLLGRALVDQGRDEEALAETEYAEQHAGGDLKTTITWLGVRAEALARRGGMDAALELARRATALAEPTDALADKADAQMALARVLRDAGDAEDARRAAETARALYQQKDHGVGVQRAGDLAAAKPLAPRAATASSSAIEDPDLAAFFAPHSELDGLLAYGSQDFVLVDHREGQPKGTDGGRFAIGEILHVSPCVIAMHVTWGGQPAGLVATVQNGRLTRAEIFESEAEISMRACFEDLRGRMLLGDRPPERSFRQFADAFARRDREALAKRWSPDTKFADHRPVSGDELHGRESMMETVDSAFRIAPDIRWVLDEVVACDERVISMRVRYMGSAAEGGGALEMAIGTVNVVENDVVVSGDRFDYDDREGMLARYRELGGRLEVLGDRPPERWWAEFKRGIDTHDLDHLLELYHEDWTMTDHRQVGAEDLRDPSALFQTIFEGSSDVRVNVEEVIACDERVIALAGVFRGTARDASGGDFELPFVVVSVIEEGRVRSTEAFDPDDRIAIMARWRELHGLGMLGELPSERFVARWVDCYGRRDVNGIAEIVDEDYVFVDRRSLGWEGHQGTDGPLETIRSVLALTRVVRAAIDEVLARDDRLWVGRMTYVGEAVDGGGELEFPIGCVFEFSETGLRLYEQFEHDDTEGMLERYRELGGQMPSSAERPSVRVLEELRSAQNDRDYDRLAELVTDDWYMVDRRALGWPEAHGRDRCLADLRSVYDASPDVRLEYEEVLAADDHVLVTLNAWRGRGLKAGEHETRAGAVHVVRDGRWAGVDFYEPDDRRAMIGRYAELGGGAGALGDRPPELACRNFVRAFGTRDLDLLPEMVTDDVVMVDHRGLAWAETTGRDAWLAVVKSGFEGFSDNRVEVEEVLACDEHVLTVVSSWRGTAEASGGGGAFEFTVGQVSVVEDGRFARIEQFEPEDREAMLARHAELSGRKDVLGGRPPERVWARYIDSFNASDFESLEQVVAPDYVFEDHRTLGYEPARGIEGGVGMLRSARKASADLRIEPDEVLACDERVIALMVLWHGRGVKAGELEIPMGVVAVVEDDRLKLHELFNPDDRDAIMARYEELAGTHATALGDRPSERLMAEVHRVLNARDYRRLAELVAEDWYFVDHRALGWEEAHGREKCMAIMRSMFDPSPHVHFDLGNPLAADDRLLVITAAVRGRGLKAGDHEVVAGAVYLIENGMWAGVDFYEPDDHQAMIARYAELGGGAGPLGDRPPEQFFKRWLPLSAAKDVEALSGMLAEDFVRVDHRSIGWEPLQGREANVALWRSAYESAECIYQEVEEVLACDPRVIAYRFSWRGIASDVSGGGEFQTSVGQVCVIEDGLWQSCDQYDTDDREAMLARYAELGGRHDAAVADRAPERFYAEYARRWASADAAGLLELIDDNWTLTDRRSLALWDQMRGRDAASKIVESSFAGVQEPAFAIQEVLACDDCVIAARVAWSGIGRGGARFSNEMGAVSVVRDGREVSLEVYDPDDRQAMIARYVELGGGLSKLGDTASERMFAEYSKRYTRRDYDGVLDLMTEDYVQVDHRTLGWNAIGKEQNAAEIRSVWAGTTDIRPEVEEVLAAEDRMLACICTYRGAADASSGGGQFEYPVGFLLVTNGERCARVEWFNPEDREALVARYAELRTDVPEAVRLGAEVIARWNRHDVDGMVELYSEDIEFVDHRALGAEPLRGSVAVREMHRAAFEVIPDSVQEIDEVLAADDRVLAFRVNIRGTSPDAGGDSGESPFGGVDVFENGKCVRVDLYDFDDRASIIARYAELGGGQGPLGELPPERFFAEFCRRWASRNVEQILGLYSNDYLNVDHRQVGWEDIDSPTAVKDFVESALAATTDLRCEVDEVLACNDTVIALRTTWRGHGADTGGEVEFKFGYVALVEDGLLVRQDHYDHDDSEGMLARYKELSAGPAAQTIIRRCELCNSRQQDELRALYAKGYELIDHRPMPWDNVSGGEGVTALVDGMLQVSPDAIVRLDVLDDDGGEVVAYRQTWSGTFGGSGLAEIEIDTVSVVRDGAIVRSELFDPDQGDELRRRVAELRGGRAVAEEVIVRDRRGLPKRDLQGVEAYRELIGADGPGELTESDGDLALFRQGDDPALLIVTRSKEGAIVEAIGTRSPKFAQAWMTALSLGRPAEVIDAFPGAFALSDADGFAAVRAGDGHTERLPDRQAAVDRAEELAGLGAWMSMARNFVQSINSRNWEAFLSMYAPDYVLVDHRLMGWGELQGPEKMIEVLRGTIELAPSAAIDLIELLDFGLAEGVGAVRQTYTGEWDGGAYEIAWDSIMVIRDGRFTRGEVFGVDQVDAMRARMAELLAGD